MQQESVKNATWFGKMQIIAKECGNWDRFLRIMQKRVLIYKKCGKRRN